VIKRRGGRERKGRGAAFDLDDLPGARFLALGGKKTIYPAAGVAREVARRRGGCRERGEDVRAV